MKELRIKLKINLVKEAKILWMAQFDDNDIHENYNEAGILLAPELWLWIFYGLGNSVSTV